MEVIEALKYPIGREEEQDVYHIAFSEPLKVQLLTEIQMLPGNLELAIQNLDAAQLETAYRPEGWTVRQVVHHVADSHINAYTRFKLGLTEDNPTIKPYDQEAWALLPDSEKAAINVSLTLLHALHSRWVTLMESLTDEQWQRTVFHPERKISLSLWELLKSYAWHGQHHVAHILQLRQRMNWI